MEARTSQERTSRGALERKQEEWKFRSAPVSLKFPAGSAGRDHMPRPFRNPRPSCCRLPTRSEPGSPSEPIRRGLRRALPFSKPIGGQPERGLPGLVGAAGCRLPGSHVRTAAYAPRLQVIAGTLVGTAGVERGPARACVSPARGGRRRDPANRSSESARAQAAPGRRLCQVPALLGRPGPGLAATSGPATATE